MTEDQWKEINDEDIAVTRQFLESFIGEIQPLPGATARIWIEPIKSILFEALMDIRQQKASLPEPEPTMKISKG